MDRYSLTHVAAPTVMRAFEALDDRERATAAASLAHLAEIDARHLYAPAGYASAYAYCVEARNWSEEKACRRIRAARAAREFPAIYPMLADGRLHLTAVLLLAPYLTTLNSDELLAAAVHLGKSGVERLLAERFPRPDLPTRIEVLTPTPTANNSPSLVTVKYLPPALEGPSPSFMESAPPPDLESPPVALTAAAPAPEPAPARVKPLAPERFAVQFTMTQEMFEDLEAIRALCSPGEFRDVAEIFGSALALLRAQLEQRKFAATEHPLRRGARASTRPRHIPAAVKRAVWQRDDGRCTFVSAAGHRCEERRGLEFDHVEPVARGGRATVRNLRLRCRAHNQFAAEQAFGSGFMTEKRRARLDAGSRRAPERREPRRCAAETPGDGSTSPELRARAAAAELAMPWLREFGPAPLGVRSRGEGGDDWRADPREAGIG